MTALEINVFPPGVQTKVRAVIVNNTNRGRNKSPTWQSVITIESLPVSLDDLDQSARWFQTVGGEIETVTSVRCSSNTVLYPSAQPLRIPGFEVLFKCGALGFVAQREHSELDALVMGQKGFLHGLAIWRKHGNIVGTPVTWFRAQPSKRGLQNPNSAPRCCAAELYARAQGKLGVWES